MDERCNLEGGGRLAEHQAAAHHNFWMKTFCLNPKKGHAGKGDSGGPVITRDTKELMGLVSWGDDSLWPREKSIGNTNVFYYREWIQKKTCNALDMQYSPMELSYKKIISLCIL